MADKRRYILVSHGGTSLDGKCESLELEIDTKESIDPLVIPVMQSVEDPIMNYDEDVHVVAYKHGITSCDWHIRRNATVGEPWEKILDFTVTDDNECTEELKLLHEGLKCGGISHVYVTVGESTPIVYAILQIGA